MRSNNTGRGLPCLHDIGVSREGGHAVAQTRGPKAQSQRTSACLSLLTRESTLALEREIYSVHVKCIVF